MSGRVMVRRLRPVENRTISHREQMYLASLGNRTIGGEVELFD